jgi:hypothetical protein
MTRASGVGVFGAAVGAGVLDAGLVGVRLGSLVLVGSGFVEVRLGWMVLDGAGVVGVELGRAVLVGCDSVGVAVSVGEAVPVANSAALGVTG